MIKNKNNSAKMVRRTVVKSLTGSALQLVAKLLAGFNSRAAERSSSSDRKRGFTLPEVIVSFAVLVMVITAATQILVTVLRVNADNVNSLVAYGLAQEGMEAVRFVRDSDKILGLQFDGATKAKLNESVWGEKLFDASGVKFFTLEMKNFADLQSGCKDSKSFVSACLPVQLKNLDVNLTTADKTEDLLKALPDVAAKTLVYKKILPVDGDGNPVVPAVTNNGLVYLQNDSASSDSTLTATQFHRFIRVESLKSTAVAADIDKLRVSSVVSWTGDSGVAMQVVLTSELTNWK